MVCMYMLLMASSRLVFCRHKSALVKASYRREYISMDGRVDLDIAGPTFKGSTVLM